MIVKIEIFIEQIIISILDAAVASMIILTVGGGGSSLLAVGIVGRIHDDDDIDGLDCHSSWGWN